MSQTNWMEEFRSIQPGITNLVESLLQSPAKERIFYQVEISDKAKPSLSDSSHLLGTTLWIPRIMESALNQQLISIGWKSRPLPWKNYVDMTPDQRGQWMERTIREEETWVSAVKQRLATSWLMAINGRLIALSRHSGTMPDGNDLLHIGYIVGTMPFTYFSIPPFEE